MQWTLSKQNILAMKLTGILLTMVFLQVQAHSYSQQVNLSLKNVPAEKVFREIEKQTGYGFLYTRKMLATLHSITIDVKNATAEQVLAACLQNQPLQYAIENKTIILREKGAIEKKADATETVAVLMPPLPPVDVHGRITDSAGNPLNGAAVTVKGSTKSTATDENGEFTLKGINNTATLVVGFVGYATREVAISGRKDIVIGLKVTNKELAEVAIQSKYQTGYQSVSRDRATGSFVQVDNELVNRNVSTNILDRIKGVTSGVLDNQASGKITIRGVSTINANQNPLIVVDGFPYDESGGFTSFNTIVNNINPNDIQDITILKDAAAASIWGVRAGNGVIVITTKKGKYNQKMKVQVNSNLTIGDKPNLFYKPTMSSKDEIGFEKYLFNTGLYNDYDGFYATSQYFPVIPKAIEVMLALKKGAITQTQANAFLDTMQNHDVRNDVEYHLFNFVFGHRRGRNDN